MYDWYLPIGLRPVDGTVLNKFGKCQMIKFENMFTDGTKPSWLGIH